jgi:hypothetical protein
MISVHQIASVVLVLLLWHIWNETFFFIHQKCNVFPDAIVCFMAFNYVKLCFEFNCSNLIYSLNLMSPFVCLVWTTVSLWEMETLSPAVFKLSKMLSTWFAIPKLDLIQKIMLGYSHWQSNTSFLFKINQSMHNFFCYFQHKSIGNFDHRCWPYFIQASSSSARRFN